MAQLIPPRPTRTVFTPSGPVMKPEDNALFNQLDIDMGRIGRDLASRAAASFPKFARQTQPFDPQTNPTLSRLRTFHQGNLGTMLPEGYLQGNLRTTGTDRIKEMGIIPSDKSRTYKRRQNYGVQGPISPSDLALASEYQRARNYPSYWYLGAAPRAGMDLKALSSEAKKRRKTYNKMMREYAMDNIFGGVESERYADAKRAYDKYKNFKAASKRDQHYDFGTGQWIDDDDAYIQDKRALLNAKKHFPAMIPAPNLKDKLLDPSIKGTWEGGQWYDDRGMDPDLVNKPFSTLTADQRKQKIGAFADLIGTLNMKPEFDARLLTPESAKFVFPEEDYEISLVDIDHNAYTPAACVISTRRATKNRVGEEIPAGTIVAINGYRLVEGNTATSTQQLRDMMYYSKYPAPSQQKDNPQRAWVRETFGLDKKKATTGLKMIADWVKQMVSGPNIILPSGKVPLIMKLTAPNTTIYYRFTTTVFNTLMSRVAELIFNHFIAPKVADAVQANPIGLAQEALVAGVNGLVSNRPETALHRDEDGYFILRGNMHFGGRQWSAGTDGPIHRINPNSPNVWQELHTHWKNGWFSTPVRNAILKDPIVVNYVRTELDSLEANVAVVLSACIDIAMRYIINPSILNFLGADDEPANLEVLTQGQIQTMLQGMQTYENIINASGSSIEDLQARYGITMRGNELLFEPKTRTGTWITAANWQ